MKIIKWDPFKDIMMVDDLFDPTNQGERRECTWTPSVDVYETERDIVLTAELPGIYQDDISLTVQDNVLTIKGERRFERDVKEESYYRIERNYGWFSRRFTMPCEVDNEQITASFADGILKVVIPKSRTTKKVKVKVCK